MIIKDIIKEKYPYLLDEHKCPICGTLFKLKYNQLLERYKRLKSGNHIILACSSSCCSKLRSIRYGSPFSNKQIQEKSRKTCNERYGNSFYNNRNKAENTCLIRYNVKNYSSLPECNEKRRKTTKEHYGVYHHWASKDPRLNGRNTKKEKYGDEFYSNKEKAIKTKLEKYNDGYYNNSDKQKKTIENKYGVKNISQIDSVKIKKKKTKLEHYGDENYNNPSKNKQTCLERYNKESYSQTEMFKQKIQNKKDEIQQKIYYTKKKNGTHSSSNPEKQIFHLLICKFPDTIWHYKDLDRYNFNCDFYIPSIDTFIEINFAFEHGGEPFDSNNSTHLRLVEEIKLKSKEINWKGKLKSRYNQKLKVWTQSDPAKLLIAKENKLNYNAFYNWKEFRNWFNNV